jgi:hypothetical protein
MAVFVFTMQNGITLISDFISESDAAFIARTPMALTPNEHVRNNVLAHKIFPFTECEIVEINKDSIMFMGSPESELIEYYYEMVDFYNRADMKLTYGMKGAVTERKKFTQTLQDMLDKATEEEDVKYIFPFNTTIH